MHPVRPFAVAALAPAGLIALGTARGGAWIWAAFLSMTLLAWMLDKALPTRARAAPDDAAADRLTVALAVLHVFLLAIVLRALSLGGTGFASWIGLFLAAGLFFGQVSNATAHELIHRSDTRLFTLGKWIYISLLFGHHSSAHLKVHHRRAASPEDPNTARRGESFYAFALRAWRGSFRDGYRAERADIIRRGRGGATPYFAYVSGAAGFLGLALIAFGWVGLGAYLALATFAQAQLLLSDYVQHYGLRRNRVEGGGLEPVGARHSWNAGGGFTTRLMLNAPRHSDHHAHPMRRFPALDLPDPADAPRLPASLPVMSVLALYPAGWRRVMNVALDRWTEEAMM